MRQQKLASEFGRRKSVAVLLVDGPVLALARDTAVIHRKTRVTPLETARRSRGIAGRAVHRFSACCCCLLALRLVSGPVLALALCPAVIHGTAIIARHKRICRPYCGASCAAACGALACRLEIAWSGASSSCSGVGCCSSSRRCSNSSLALLLVDRPMLSLAFGTAVRDCVAGGATQKGVRRP